MSFNLFKTDFFGDLVGKVRRRRLEAEARQLLRKAKPALISLTVQSIDAMPQNSNPLSLTGIAQVLVKEALTDSAALDLVPTSLQNTVQATALVAVASARLPQQPLADFQIAAKAAVAAAINKI